MALRVVAHRMRAEQRGTKGTGVPCDNVPRRRVGSAKGLVSCEVDEKVRESPECSGQTVVICLVLWHRRHGQRMASGAPLFLTDGRVSERDSL